MKRKIVLSILAVTMIGCADTLQIYGTGLKESRVHQVTEVTYIASKEEVLSVKELTKALDSSGIHTGDIRNGSVVIGRVYCCGGEGTVETAVPAWVFVPPSLMVEKGDILEFKVGAGPKAAEGERINRAVKVRQKNGVNTKECRWEPDEPGLWMRVLRCRWMENEGWIEGRGLDPVWYKPVE
jgi:hypothetical protein